MPQSRAPISGPNLMLNEDRDFLYALAGSLAFYTAVALIAYWLPTPSQSVTDIRQIPPRIARLIIETPKPPPLTAVQQPKEPIPLPPQAPKAEPREEAPRPAPKKQAEEKPAPAKPAEPPPLTEEQVRLREQEQARETERKNREIAMQSGLLRVLTQERKAAPDAGKDLDRLLEQDGLKRLESPPIEVRDTPGPELSESRGIDDLIAALKDADTRLDIGAGSTGLGERQAARIESPFEILNPGGEEITRSYESIQEVVDALRGWIRFIYNRALREDPTLKGTITLEFTIAPAGDVTDCRIVSSTLKHASLERQLVERFRRLKFQPIPSGINIVIYPITLIPSE